MVSTTVFGASAQTMPGIVGAGLLVFVFSLGFYITPAILGGGRTTMIAEYIGLQILTTLRWGLATMLGGSTRTSIRPLPPSPPS